jgi:hypothetical protein
MLADGEADAPRKTDQVSDNGNSEMKKMKLRTFATTTAAALLVLATPGTAAAVGCHDDGCDGKWPTPQGCDNDASTRYSKQWPNNDSHYQLRHSAKCDSNWLRILDYRPDSHCAMRLMGRVQNRYRTRVPGDYTYKSKKVVQEKLCITSDWTTMLGDLGAQTRICWAYQYYDWSCSGWM